MSFQDNRDRLLGRWNKLFDAFIIVLLLSFGTCGYVKWRVNQSELARLRNQVAEKDKTIEIAEGKYTKLSGEYKKFQSSDADLKKLFKKTSQDLVSEQQVSLYWKNKYDFILSHPPGKEPTGDWGTPAGPGQCTEKQLEYTSTQDLGFMKLSLATLSFDPKFQQKLTVQPGSTPLQLTVDLTRDQNKQWHTYVVSSDKNVGVDIKLSSVTIEPLSKRWYERIRVHADAAVGSSFVGGLGASVEIGSYIVGPSVWGTKDGPVYGMNFSWAPFQRN